ncbi:hypothetical protein Psuf_020440 [Phytohabitans suffuscus]|uniref:Uncharacterized protein n=1 Tax=Phytohabitans suffuscus TaxID=624315 RepID=A0A6F8YFL0_9ACTN|nr:hypothetical protein Psuf_020440 [Phytohabitans suffuscus]
MQVGGERHEAQLPVGHQVVDEHRLDVPAARVEHQLGVGHPAVEAGPQGHAGARVGAGQVDDGLAQLVPHRDDRDRHGVDHQLGVEPQVALRRGLVRVADLEDEHAARRLPRYLVECPAPPAKGALHHRVELRGVDDRVALVRLLLREPPRGKAAFE